MDPALVANLSAADRMLLMEALSIATEAHSGFTRNDGSSYLSHVLSVANRLLSWSAPATIVAVGLLHDILNREWSTEGNLGRIETTFGSNIAHLVESVSRLNQLTAKASPHKLGFFESLGEVDTQLKPQILDVGAEAFVVKFADRLHNLATIQSLPYETQQRSALVIQSTFVPIADELGMRRVRNELDELSFQIANPVEYAHMKAIIADRDIANIAHRAEEDLANLLTAMPGHEIRWAPSTTSTLSLTRIDSVSRAAVLVNSGIFVITVPDDKSCYASMGMLHQRYQPTERAIRDYIASPKPNGYRALHTQLRSPTQDPNIPVSIRSREMDLIDEHGVMAKWHGVKEHMLPQRPFLVQPTPDNLRVFTPLREQRFLPIGATIIDFAFSIHHEVGHQCIGAKVNGDSVPLDYVLQPDDTVEIITDRTQTPHTSYAWLKIATTDTARKRIRQHLSTTQRRETEQTGRTLLDNELQLINSRSDLPSVVRGLAHIAQLDSLASVEDLLVFIGTGRYRAKQVVQRLQALGKITVARNIIVHGEKGLPPNTVYAACCSPLPPEDIVGLRRGKVLEIHKANCQAIQSRTRTRRQQVNWSEATPVADSVIRILSYNRPGLVTELSNLFSLKGIDMLSFVSSDMLDGRAQTAIHLGRIRPAQLHGLVDEIKKVTSVISVSPEDAFDFKDALSATPIAGKRRSGSIFTNGVARNVSYVNRPLDEAPLVDKIRSHLSAPIVLWGQKRIGKTSLLEHIKQILSDDGPVVMMDLHRFSGATTAVFLGYLADGIEAAVQSAYPQTANELKTPTARHARRDIVGYLRQLSSRYWRVGNGSPLLVIFDEFQYLLQLKDTESVDLQSLLSCLRGLAQDGDSFSFVYSGAGLHSRMVSHAGLSDLLNRSDEQRLGYLDPKAAGQLPAKLRDNMHVDDKAIDYLVEMTAGHPWYLQQLSRYIDDESIAGRVSELRVKEASAIVNAWLMRAADLSFAHLWQIGPAHDETRVRAVLCALASKPGTALSALKVIDLLGNPTWANHAYDYLEDLHALQIVKRNSMGFVIEAPLFERWLGLKWPIQRALTSVEE